MSDATKTNTIKEKDPMNEDRKDIEDLKARNPIDEILAERGHYPVAINGDQQLYLSPLREEGAPSFYVRLGKASGGVYFDFGSARGGDVITLIQELEGLSNKDAIRYLRERRP
jgi:DNA primase